METKSYNFSGIKLADLEKLVKLKKVYTETKFDDWFQTSYVFTEKDTIFLQELIERNALFVTDYLEEDLKAKFLIPIFNQVRFFMLNGEQERNDWYDAALSGTIGGVEISGFADYMVAEGIRTPRKPYFFIQEFKPSIPDRNPEVQLLAELLVAVEQNQTHIVRGAYIIGQIWRFVILEKIAENKYQYFVSPAFDSLKLPELKQIYSILQAVKSRYCKD